MKVCTESSTGFAIALHVNNIMLFTPSIEQPPNFDSFVSNQQFFHSWSRGEFSRRNSCIDSRLGSSLCTLPCRSCNFRNFRFKDIARILGKRYRLSNGKSRQGFHVCIGSISQTFSGTVGLIQYEPDCDKVASVFVLPKIQDLSGHILIVCTCPYSRVDWFPDSALGSKPLRHHIERAASWRCRITRAVVPPAGKHQIVRIVPASGMPLEPGQHLVFESHGPRFGGNGVSTAGRKQHEHKRDHAEDGKGANCRLHCWFASSSRLRAIAITASTLSPERL